jgi:pilus assembly protein CpaB
MSRRVLAVLLIALVISGAATYAVYRAIRSRVAGNQATATTPIVQAARALDLGAVITDADLKIGSWVGSVPEGMFTKKDTLIGRGIISPINEGEPIADSRLAPVGAGGGLAATIPPGMRAVAVRADQIIGVAGFVVPGMRVDVLISGNPPGAAGTSGPRVRTLLQNVEVLSAGQNYQRDAAGKPVVVPVVNLLVTPEQAEIVSLANAETRIQFVLRNPLDTKSADVTGTGVANLFGAAPAPPPSEHKAAPAPRTTIAAVKPPAKVEPPPPPPPPIRIEVINGPQKSEASFVRPPEENK